MQHAYPRLETANLRWGATEAIRILLDAKAPGDRLTSRALKAAICMEVLKSRYLQSGGRTRVIEDKSFREKIAIPLEGLLLELLPESQDSDIRACFIKNLPNLNWYSFKRTILEMCTRTHFQMSPYKDIKRPASIFVDIRNRLVHDGRFLTPNPKKLELQSETDQFRFMVGFLDHFLEWILLHDLSQNQEQS